MNVICRQCKAKISIPDNKIPRDQDATITCPKCKGKILIPAAQPASGSTLEEKPNRPSRLAFVDRINAMVCVGDPALRGKVSYTAKEVGCSVLEAMDTKTAIEKMDYQVFHLVIVDQTFDQSKGMDLIISKMNTMDMSHRRKICFMLIRTDIGTDDAMAALHISANSVINLNDIAHLEPFMVKALEEHKQLYTVYNESLKSAGKA